jgi:ribosomal protein S18 acetylase RimI-like enzyme
MIVRRATLPDIPATLRIEQSPEYRSFIGRWTAEKHAETISDAGSAYFVVEGDTGTVIGSRCSCM